MECLYSCRIRAVCIFCSVKIFRRLNTFFEGIFCCFFRGEYALDRKGALYIIKGKILYSRQRVGFFSRFFLSI